MMNRCLFNLYWAMARLGLGIGAIAYDLNIPHARCASRREGFSELD